MLAGAVEKGCSVASCPSYGSNRSSLSWSMRIGFEKVEFLSFFISYLNYV